MPQCSLPKSFCITGDSFICVVALIEASELYDKFQLFLWDTDDFLILSEVNHDRVRHFTLMDVLTHSEVPFTSFSSLVSTLLSQIVLLFSQQILLLKVTAKFKCAVRVVAVMPCQAEELCAPDGTYLMRLTLEDPTARIHAYVAAEDGVRTHFNSSDFQDFFGH